MKDLYFNSPVPSRVQIDIPQYMAVQVLKKEVGPYICREAQATVFHHLYGYWQDYQVMSHDLSPMEIVTELHKMEGEMKQLRKVLFSSNHLMLREYLHVHVCIYAYSLLMRGNKLKTAVQGLLQVWPHQILFPHVCTQQMGILKTIITIYMYECTYCKE